jgi:hypothetical protein
MKTHSTSTLAAVAPATTCSRLAKCSVCGRITNTWDSYGSLFLEEEYPGECVYVCSAECMDAADEKIQNGTWRLPKLKKTYGGAFHDISKRRKGYDHQPSQEAMVKALLHAANVKVMAHPLAGANVDRGVRVEIRCKHRKQRG